MNHLRQDATAGAQPEQPQRASRVVAWALALPLLFVATMASPTSSQQALPLVNDEEVAARICDRLGDSQYLCTFSVQAASLNLLGVDVDKIAGYTIRSEVVVPANALESLLGKADPGPPLYVKNTLVNPDGEDIDSDLTFEMTQSGSLSDCWTKCMTNSVAAITGFWLGVCMAAAIAGAVALVVTAGGAALAVATSIAKACVEGGGGTIIGFLLCVIECMQSC